MENLINNLQFDYNYNVFLAKALLPGLDNVGDKILVNRWLQKLDKSCSNLDELRLRNEFLYQLLLHVQAGRLQPPFDSKPPCGNVLGFAHLLSMGRDERAVEPGAGGAGGTGSGETRPLVYERSPDGGAFLAAQPVPRAGAFAYLAVLCRPT